MKYGESGMSEKWYDGLPDDFFESNADKAYRKASDKIREGLEKGLGFDEAVSGIDVTDEALRTLIINDMLKVILAEEHFAKNAPLDGLSRKLKIPLERLESVKQVMFEDVADSSANVPIKSFKVHLPDSGDK